MDRDNQPDNADSEIRITWRPIVFGPAAVALFFLALWFNDVATDARGPVCLGLSFALVMLWVMFAARASNNPDSPLRTAIPKLLTFIILGTAFVGAARWHIDKRVSALEVGFAAFYMITGYIAIRSFNARSR
jgi:hypothetical protein